jgi:hypothetical protein
MVTDVPAEVLMQRMQEFSKLWQRYMEFFDQALETEEVNATEEKDFRKLQVEIIRKSQFLTLAVPNNIFDLSKDVRKLFVQTPSLRLLKTEAPIKISSFRSLWHDVSIALNQKHGQLRHFLEDREAGKGRRK